MGASYGPIVHNADRMDTVRPGQVPALGEGRVMDWIGARHDQAATGPSELLLSDEAATELLASRYPVMTPRVRRRLDTALDNPLALLELPVSLGDLAQTVAGALPAELPPGRRLQTAFASRVQARPRSMTSRAALRDALADTPPE